MEPITKGRLTDLKYRYWILNEILRVDFELLKLDIYEDIMNNLWKHDDAVWISKFETYGATA